MINYSVIKHCSVFESSSKVTLVEEEGRCISFEKNQCKITVIDSYTEEPDSRFLFKCYGVLGSVTFLNHTYLVVVTEASKCGRILMEHDVYKITAQKLIPLFEPFNISSREKDFIRVFTQFDISNHFYFSYTYNLCNSLQINMSYNKLLKNEQGYTWLIFDSVITEQKYCYNFTHKRDLSKMNEESFNLTLSIIHGFFSESVINVSGRNMTFTLISRRSRFYSGTRYRKRGITGGGHVANDVETEQILHDWTITNSLSSFVLVRGSTPIFWAQDPNESFLKKPPIFYTQNDPTNSSLRTHFRELISYYGGPVVVLNLLSDNPLTEEGMLSERYKNIIEELNEELPSFLKILYYSKNIKYLMEKGVAKQMLKEVVETVLNKIKLTYMSSYKNENNNVQVQRGVIRISCLDCLDRTSAFAKHLSLRMFKHQLELIGIKINYDQSTCLITNYLPNQTYITLNREFTKSHSSSIETIYSNSNEEGEKENIVISDYFRFNYVKGLLFEVVKDRYEEMCDEISMQYAGSKALRKYEGQSTAISISTELITTVKRRYRNFFEDTRIQEQSNAFLCAERMSHYSRMGANVVQKDLDDMLHFRPITMSFNNTDSFILSFLVYQRRVSKLINNNNNNNNKNNSNKNNDNNNNNNNNDNNNKNNELNITDHDSNYLIHTTYLNLLLSNADHILRLTQDCSNCSILSEINQRTLEFKMIARGYLTIDLRPEEGYTSLSSYTPANKAINLINTDSASDAQESLFRTTTASSTSISSAALGSGRADSDEGGWVPVRDTQRDYANFLAPGYRYCLDHWSLDPRSNLESLNRFINIAT